MKLKLKLANWVLNRKAAEVSRKVKVHNFDSAKTVGVLWSVDEESAFHVIQQYLKGYKNITLQSLYYNHEKNANISDKNSFCKEHLNWLGFPKPGMLEDFMNQEWDLLIDLSVEKKFPVQVIAALSKAAFKVGYGTDNNNPYDMNIDIHAKPEPEYLAEQIINYLNTINKKTHDNTSI